MQQPGGWHRRLHAALLFRTTAPWQQPVRKPLGERSAYPALSVVSCACCDIVRDVQSPITTRRGNQLGGYFTLTLLGHTTVPIPYDAARSTMKAALEGLDNVGTVRGRTRCAPAL
jgi:hypothetical protein